MDINEDNDKNNFIKKKKIFMINNLNSGLNDALQKFYYIYKIFKYLGYDYYNNNFLKCKMHYKNDSLLLVNLGFDNLTAKDIIIDNIKNKLEIKELIQFIIDHNRNIDLMIKTLNDYDCIEINICICNDDDDSILFGFSNSLKFPIKNIKNFYNDIFIQKNTIDYTKKKNNIIIHVRMNDYCYINIGEKIFSCNSLSYTNENHKTLKYYYEKINDIINNNKSTKIYIFSNLFSQELFKNIKCNYSESESNIIIDEINNNIEMYNSLKKNNVKIYYSNNEENIFKFILFCNKSNIIYKTTGTFTNLANIYYNHLKIIKL